MSFSTELLAYVDTQLGSGWTSGTNLFLDFLPAGATAKLALYENGGEPADQVIAVYRPYYRLVSFATDLTTARANWETAFNVLNRLKDVKTTNYQIVLIEGQESGPRPVVTEANNHVLESDLRVVYKNLND